VGDSREFDLRVLSQPTVSGSVPAPTAEGCCTPALRTPIPAQTSAHQRQSAHAIGMGYFAGCAYSGSRQWLESRRSGVRPWAPPTDVTATNPDAPTEVKSGSVGSYGRAAFCDCANSDRNSDRALTSTLSPASACRLGRPACGRPRCAPQLDPRVTEAARSFSTCLSALAQPRWAQPEQASIVCI